MSEENQRRHPRSSLFQLADCLLARSGRREKVKLRNLSAQGVLAEGSLDPVVGDLVEMDLRQIGTVAGMVMWTSAPRFGVQFAEPIDTEAVLQTKAPAGQADPRTYYQRGPVAVLPRQNETDPKRLRRI